MMGQIVTALRILTLVSYAKLTIKEIVIVRITFSIYCGWICSIIYPNGAFFFKAIGIRGDWIENLYTFMFVVAASVIYIAFCFLERNPLFGLIFIWTLWGIHEKQVSQNFHEEIIVVYSFFLFAITVLCIHEKIHG